jgi:hypothetical protein
VAGKREKGKGKTRREGTGEMGEGYEDVSLTEKTQTRATANDEQKNIVGSVKGASGREGRGGGGDGEI